MKASQMPDAKSMFHRNPKPKEEVDDLEQIRRELAHIREFIADARRVLNEVTDLAQKLDMKIMAMQIKQLEATVRERGGGD